MNKFSQELYQIIINHAPELVSAFGLFMGFYIAGLVVKKVINSLSLAKQLNPAIVRLLGPYIPSRISDISLFIDSAVILFFLLCSNCLFLLL